MNPSNSGERKPESFTQDKYPALGRLDGEMFWVHLYPFLLERGYQLRPRYSPDWVPSWSGIFGNMDRVEDGIYLTVRAKVIDAVRLSDGQRVVLKRTKQASRELQILCFLNDPRRREDHRNRTIALLDTIPLPDSDGALAVLPYGREFDSPPFHCRSEFVEAMSQFLEGLEFLHENGICHGDIAPKNMLMGESTIVPRGSHFAAPLTHGGTSGIFRWRKRCSCPANAYFFIDFDHSLQFDSPDARNTALATGTYGRFVSNPPEASLTVPFNPFRVDVFQLGIVMQNLINNYPALEIFRPVADDMMLADPFARPTPAASLAHLHRAANSIPRWRAKLPIKSKGGGLWRTVQRVIFGGHFADRWSRKDAERDRDL
ncbi:Protein kinase domain-containing protein [Mycena kentingensis (nom. inval.)]|nr:Protein kinase domain-containing protein [Mycena kentingensis (nom. inval.)]